jgi:hypothetical protein
MTKYSILFAQTCAPETFVCFNKKRINGRDHHVAQEVEPRYMQAGA